MKSMKTKWSAAIASLFAMLLISTANASFLGPNNLDHGYFLTSNYSGKDAPPGATLIVTAETTDVRVTAVRFLWFAPDGSLARISPRISVWENSSEWTNGTGSYTIYFAEDGYEPSLSGHWGVVAIFLDLSENIICRFSIFVAIRFTFFNVIPEIQALGTAGSAGIMVLGLALFIIKGRKQKPTI